MEAIDINTRTELFIDKHLIMEMKNSDLKVHIPTRSDVVFSCNAPWEDGFALFNSIVDDGDKIYLYYRASVPDRTEFKYYHAITALAVSTDRGRSFIRPNLGLINYAGNKNNNILMIGAPNVPAAFLDANPDCKPDERYKGLSATDWKTLYAMCSSDGVKWRLMRKEPLMMEGYFDTIVTAFWDRRTGSYRSFFRDFIETDPNEPEKEARWVRAIQSSTSQDFLNWTPAFHYKYLDNYHDMHLYTNATIPCPGAEHIYLAFPMRFVYGQFPARLDKYRYKRADGIVYLSDALFMTSRDCVHWNRHPEAWIRPGLDEKNWSCRSSLPVSGLVETSDTEWSIYVIERYGIPDESSRLRRLVVRPHGFMSAHAGYEIGEVVTKSIIFSGCQLRLNYSTSAAGSVRIEIQDESGEPIEGFRLDDMAPYVGDEIDAPVTWEKGGDISTLARRPIRFRFVLKDADIFSFRTAPGFIQNTITVNAQQKQDVLT